MLRELLEMASDLARRGEPFAIATVVARKAPTSVQIGDAALVTSDGGFHGWVGGSCTRPTVIEESLKAIALRRSRLIALDPDPAAHQRPGLEVFPMTCHSGGSVEIHIQPVLPAPRLLVYGISPVARALCRIATAMGYRVSAIDPMADTSTFPGAEAVLTDPSQLRVEAGSRPVFAVVATQGQWDEEATLAALAHAPDYLGVVASRRRFGEIRSLLEGRAPEARLLAIKNPAGIDIGAELPEEIALSIVAEIVKAHRQAPSAVLDETRAAVADKPPEAPAPAALDPVCGMTVRKESAKHHIEHHGREIYFCGGRCRERFIATPERYEVAEVAP